MAAGDLLLYAIATDVDSATHSAQSLTASGLTFTRTNRASAAVTSGNDHRHVVETATMTGSGTSAPTYSATLSASASGVAGFLRIREGFVPVAPTIGTQPTDQSAAVGATATFTASAPNGDPVAARQWQVLGTGAPPVTASDDFNRADGPLGANWTTPIGSASISSNAISFGSADTVVRYEGQTFAADQEASFVIGNPGDTHCGGGVRIQADGSGYICTNETEAVFVQIYRSNGGGSLTGLANITGLTLVSGDRIGLRAIGSTIGLTQNGVVVGSVTDGTYTTGQPGGYGFFNTGDEWQASEVGGATWTAIPGATGTNYTTPALALIDNGNQYRFTDTNAAGSVTSNPAALTVTAASTSLTPPLLDSTAVLFAPAVTTGSVPVTPPLLDSAAVLFAPAVSQPAGGTPWTIQPPPDTPIDTGNPLAAGLFFAFSGADTYGTGVARNTTPLTIAEGIAASATTTDYSDANALTNLAAPVTSSEWTLAMAFSSPTPANAYEVAFGIVGTSSANRIHLANRIFSTSNLGVDARPYAADRESGTAAPGPDVLYHYAITIGADVRQYLDGFLISTSANGSLGNALEFDRVEFFNKIGNGDQSTIGAKILSAQAYSTAKTATEIADLAANPWQIYTPDAGGGALVLTPPLLDSTAVLFAPAVTTGSVPVTPPLLDSAAVLFAPAVSNLAGTEEFAFEDAVFDAGAFDTGGAEEFAFDDGAFDARAFDTGADSTGALTLTPPLLDNSAALFAPAVTTGAVALTPPLLDNSALLFAPTVVQIAPGTQAVSLPLLDNSAALFVPGITTGAVSLTFPLLDSAAVLLAPGITIGGVSLTFPLLDSAASPFAPSITQGPPGNQMLTIPLLSSAAVVFAPSITQTDPPDETAPILSAPTGVAVGSAAGAGTITTDEANGTLYWVTTINAVELEATVQAGLSQSVVAAGVQNVYTPGLTAETAYYHHFVQVDAAGNTSTVVSSGQFTTTAPPAAGQGSSSRMSIGIQIGL
jgi:hypothetical protein